MTTVTTTRDTRVTAALAAVDDAFEMRPTAGTPAWLQPSREKAFATFRGTGLPLTRHEDWKYTSLAGFAERSAAYLQNHPSGDDDAAVNALLDALPDAEDGIRIVFVNGRYRDDLSNTSRAEPGVDLTPYSATDAETGSRILNRQPVDDNALIALNTAFLTDGLAIRVAEGCRVDGPMHVIFVADGQPAAVQPRLSVELGRNARAFVVQHHIGTGEALTNAVTRIDCAEQSHLFFVRLQDESHQSIHVANQLASVATDGRLDSVSIDFGAQLARNDLELELNGERAHANLFGLFMANGSRHVDNHLRVDHRMPNTTSMENYRGIISDAARGVFNGKIIVHPGADGTDAQMSNRNLLLSERAEIDTKPELEIYTDDVKCAHGSTTGRLDANSIFYLRARGIPEAEARMMLVAAFAQEIIDHVRSRAPMLADYLSHRMSRQLPDSA